MIISTTDEEEHRQTPEIETSRTRTTTRNSPEARRDKTTPLDARGRASQAEDRTETDRNHGDGTRTRSGGRRSRGPATREAITGQQSCLHAVHPRHSQTRLRPSTDSAESP